MKRTTLFEAASIAALLILITSLGVFLRLQNLALLEGQYLIGTDPYRHFRHSEQIVERGQLPPIDTMRHAPVGLDNTTQATFFAWLFAQGFQGLQRVWPNLSLREAAMMYPVGTFALLLLVFFLLVRKLFDLRVALLSALALATTPAFVFRTIAGNFDRDPITILLFLLALYLYVSAWKCSRFRAQFLLALSSGVTMAVLGLIWPGIGVLIAIFLTCHLIRLWADEFSDREFVLAAIWCMPILMALLFLTRFYRAHLTHPFTLLAIGFPCLFLCISSATFLLRRYPQAHPVFTLGGRLPLGLSVSGIFGLLLIFLLILLGQQA